MRSATVLALVGLGLFGTACPSATPAPACTPTLACPSGQVCADGTCLILSQVSRSFAAVVVPLDPEQLSQEYLGIDPSEGPNDLTLDLPASLDATIPIPAICSPGEALPLLLTVTRHPRLPISNATRVCKSDLLGTFACPLPANEPIDLALAPSLACAAPGTQNGQAWSPGPVNPSTFGFLPPQQTLTIVGTLSAVVYGGVAVVDGGVAALSGASVTVLAAGGPRAGQPISATMITQPRDATCLSDGGFLPDSGPCSTVGFVIPVALDQVLLDGGGCAPPTDNASCLLDGGCPFSPCATLLLEVGPSGADGGATLPSIDFLVQRQITPADPAAASVAGPTLSLMGDSQLGIQLPIGPGNDVISGTIRDPSGFSVTGALAQLRSVGSLDACLGQPLVATDPSGITLCSYSARAISSAGQVSIEAPPGTYSLTVSPPASQSTLAPHVSSVVIPPNGGTPIPQPSLVRLQLGTKVSGQVVDPRNGHPLVAGQVRVLPLNSDLLINATQIDDHGNFTVFVAPTPDAGVPDVFLFQPAEGLGLAASSKIVSVPTQDLNLNSQAVSVGVPITGTVFARTLDGSRRPLASASVRFYVLYANGDEFAVAIPAGNAVTDAVGRYATTVPNVPPQ